MKKILESVGEIRLDVGEHRICLEDVLCFLTGRDVYDHVAQRFKTLASTHGLKALGNALARTPGHMFRGVGGSRSKSMTYISKPSEFTKIVVELVRHYYSTRLNKGRNQGQVATLWPKVVDFHLNLGRTWPELWDAAHCGACGEAPLLADAGGVAIPRACSVACRTLSLLFQVKTFGAYFATATSTRDST